jgi:hypothetical protein
LTEITIGRKLKLPTRVRYGPPARFQLILSTFAVLSFYFLCVIIHYSFLHFGIKNERIALNYREWLKNYKEAAGQPRLAETRLAECPFGRNPFGRIDPTGRKFYKN